MSLAWVIIPTCNDSKSNVRNVVKIYISTISNVNFTISITNSEVYIEKIKVRYRPPHVDEPLRPILRHQIEVDNNPCWLVQVSFLYGSLYWN